MKVAVVILNWNGLQLLRDYLPSVIKNSPSDTDIYVADNASSDASISFIKQNYPQIKIIQLDNNYGYAGGYNRALQQVDADLWVLLNSDVEVTPHWIEPVVARLDQHPNIAAIQPKILAYNDKKSFEYAGAAGGFIDHWGYSFCRGRIFDHLEEDLGQYDRASEIFWASGACLFIRSNIYLEMDGLDTDFFAHMEEIDLCWRIKNRGYEIWYEPKSTVYHLGGGTLHQARWQKSYLNFRNNLFLLVKNDYTSWFWFKLFYRMVLDGISAIKFIFDGHPMHAYSVLKAHIKFYLSLGKMMRKRKKLKRSSTQKDPNGILKKSVVWAYFFKKKKTYHQITETRK